MAKTEQITQAKTFIEAVKESLTAAGGYNSGDAVPPAAILWADADGEWRPIVEKLRPLMPELLMLGAFAPEQRTGPAIWMRCVIEGTLPEVKLPEKSVPVLYLPKVSRQLLRSPEDCPDALKPLVELQYRGAVWTQVNGKDWTVEAFLVSENGGLGLDVGRDQKTRNAMLGALDALATTPIAALRGRKLEAEDFDKLMVGDTVRDLLAWVNDPAGCKEEWDAARWAAFKSRCHEEYGFDPDTDGELVAAERLGSKQGPWAKVWNRVAESPALYMGLPAILRRAKPATLLFDREPWPDENEKDEASLRKEFVALKKLKPAQAREVLVQLDQTHSERRQWVWARIGLSSLAMALEHLKTLAENTPLALAGDSPDAIGTKYAKTGYRVDDAVLRALAAVKTAEDREAVCAAIRVVYLPWLEDTARNFQAAARKEPLPDSTSLKEHLVAAEPNECMLFVDGLRYDVAQRLLARAHERQLTATEGYRWAALPTVTATAKPAVSPVATSVVGEEAGADFCPVFSDGMKPVNAERLREAVTNAGYQVLHGLDDGQPQLENARAWTECGEFDTLGHKLQAKLAGQIDDQLDLLLDRILHLLAAGWRTVRVVTDHGWLLMPGGLPDLPLKKYLAECRWSRCAVIKEGANADVPTAGWFWDRTQAVAYAPGAYCFLVGTEYAHGGLSPQECLIPDLVFSSPAQSKELQVTIESVQWVGLRCRVVIKPALEGLSAGLRLKPNDASSSICAPKLFDNEGRAGLLVEDENLLGSAAILVVLDSTGRTLCKQPTIVGGNI
jgi:hypothetical protein